MEKFVKDLFTESIVEKVASLYEVNTQQLYLVGGFENYVYGFDKLDQSYIVRVSHSSHRTVEEVRAEIDFLFYLARNGAKVSMPIHTIHGLLVECIHCEDESYFTVCGFTKAEGKVPSRSTATNKMYYNYGKTIGVFHRLTKSYKESDGIQKRFVWDQDLLIKHASNYLSEEDAFIIQRLNKVVTDIHTIDKNVDNFGLILTDVHMGNFFVKEDELTVFDFDDCCYHYFASDIAIALFYLVFMLSEGEQQQIADKFMIHFMKGYSEVNRLPEADYMSIPKFLKLRELVLYLVIFKTVDVNESKFAKAYIDKYRNRILNGIPFINLDFKKYYK